MKLNWATVLFSAFLLTSCSEDKPVNHKIVEEVNKRKKDPWNVHAVDSSVGLLKTGDIVMRTGNDITSYMLCQLNSIDKTYSHCGLVMIENGYPFVYHSIGGEDNPNEELQRDSAAVWLSPSRNKAFGIVRLDLDEEKSKSLSAVVYNFYKQRKKFDMEFDIRTDDRFYCAEFVYKSVNQAMANNDYIKPVTIMGYTFIGIDNLFLNDHARMICQVRFK